MTHCSRCGSLLPPPPPRLPPEVAAEREAARKRRRQQLDERFRPPTPQEARERDRRAALDVIGCLMPIPVVAAVAGGALVILADEAIPVAILATVAGSLAGWLGVLLVYVIGQPLFYARPSLWLQIYTVLVPWIPFALAIGATVLVSRIV